jgi:plasmid maintenance system antidote protein VapI
MKKKTYRFCPDYYVPTGATVESVLEERGISRKIFAKTLGQSESFVNRLICGNEIVTPVIAEQLASTLGSTKDFWLRREKTYRKDKKRIEAERARKSSRGA